MSATEWKASLVTQRNSTNRRVGVPLIRQTPDLSFRFSNKVVYLFSLEKLISKKYIEISSSMILTWIKKRSFITDSRGSKTKTIPLPKRSERCISGGFRKVGFPSVAGYRGRLSKAGDGQRREGRAALSSFHDQIMRRWGRAETKECISQPAAN